MGDTEHFKKESYKESHKLGCTRKCSESKKGFSSSKCSYRQNGYDYMKDKANPYLGQIESNTPVTKNRELYEVDFTQDENAARLVKIFPEYYKGATDNIGPDGKRDTRKFLPSGEKNAMNWREAENPILDKKAWWFSKPENFKTDYMPYGNNYHHIMPATSLNKEFSNDEQDLLQQVGYNIHDGKNMIILPKIDAYGFALLLHSHYTNHRKYNKDIVEKLKELRPQLKEKMDAHQITSDDGAKNVKKALEFWQEEEFIVIVEDGRKYAKEEIKDVKKEFNDYGMHVQKKKRGTINNAKITGMPLDPE